MKTIRQILYVVAMATGYYVILISHKANDDFNRNFLILVGLFVIIKYYNKFFGCENN